MSLTDELQKGVEAMREGRWQEAADAIAPVYENEDLAGSSDLQDIYARVCSLYGQILVELGRPRDAHPPIRKALRILRRLRDQAGITQVRKLEDAVVKSIAHDAEREARLQEQRTIADTPLAVLMMQARTEAERGEVLIKKAGAHLDVGEPEEAARLAEEGLELVDRRGVTHWRVMGRITLARAVPERATALLTEAQHLADEASEFNLISTIATAAELTGARLPVQQGPVLGPAHKKEES